MLQLLRDRHDQRRPGGRSEDPHPHFYLAQTHLRLFFPSNDEFHVICWRNMRKVGERREVVGV